jgi:hypothetical protein
VQEEVIYRCINPVCARPMPRPVNFCPWCGTAQRQGLVRADAAAALPGWTDVPLPANAPPAPPAASQAPPQAPRPAPEKNAPGTPPPPSATDFGRSASGAAGAGAAAGTGAGQGRGKGADRLDDKVEANPAPRQEVPRPSIAARPPQRKPVQLRWWILALALLWGVWLLARPSPRKIERQIEHAAALARDCKGSEAQAELIALRDSRATPEQLERLQKTLNDQSAICTKRRQRNKAWLETSAAADAALDAGSADRARTRLQGFIRRWGEDDRTRALKVRIDVAAAREKHPLAVPREGAE